MPRGPREGPERVGFEQIAGITWRSNPILMV